MFFMYCPTEVLEYVTFDVYFDGAVARMSAPFRASVPVRRI
jgi:hypothetical protein